MNTMESSIIEPLEVTGNARAREKDERPKKRLRVWAACDECRLKKVKCDGQRPVCSPCAKRYGTSATCTRGSRKDRQSDYSKDFIHLERQSFELESEGGSYTAQISADSSILADLTESSLKDEWEIESSAMMGLIENSHQNSSAKSFMNQIRLAINQQSTSPEQRVPEQRSGVTKYARGKLGKMLDYQLPSRERADHLLKCYWHRVDSLYLFLDRDETIATYRDLWTGEAMGEDTRLFICLLNVIFSVASLLDITVQPEERVDQANMFYLRARDLLKFDLIEHRSVLTVQCFLVFGQYLQSTEDLQECWIFVGLAIRIAQSLGLDLPATSAVQNEQKKNLLRRVWHGCVLMDRTLSMNFGRPTMITAQAAALVPYPSAHPGSKTCKCFIDRFEPESNASECHFFIESLKLYDLMGSTLLVMYSPSKEERSPKDVYEVYFGTRGAAAAGDIMAMESKLSSWFRSLPIHLGRDLAVQRAPAHVRQSNVLWLKYCHLRMLLFRPVMARLCCKVDKGSEAESVRNTMPWKMAFQCSITCVKAAMDTIDFFRVTLEQRAQQELDDFLPAWWFSTLYVYTAAIVLTAARLNLALLDEITEATIIRAWETVVNAMKYLGRLSKHARHCAAAVNVLFLRIPQKHRRQEQPSSQNTNLSQQTLDSHPQPKSQQQHDSGRRRSRQVMGLNHITTTGLPPSMPCNNENIDCGARSCDNENQLWPASQYLSTAADTYVSDMDYLNPFDMSNQQPGPGDMTWLNSVPLQLYNTQ